MTSKTKLDKAIEKLGKKRALNLLQVHMANVSAGIEKPKQDISFQEFVEKWKQEILPLYKPSTQKPLLTHLAIFTAFFNMQSLSVISSEKMQNWISSRQDSPKTIRNYVGTFKSLWRSASDWGYVTFDPTASLRLPKRDLIETPELTPEQALEVIRKAEEPYKTLFWIVAETGMRGGEVCGLFVDDVDFDRQMIHVRRSAWRGQLQTPKSGNAVRQFPISHSLSEHIRTLVNRIDCGTTTANAETGSARGGVARWCRAIRGTSDTGGSNPSTALLFSSVSGRPLDNGLVVRDVLRPILKQAGIYKQGMGLHAFRHMNLSVMGSLGVPAKVVQERAGHASYSTSLGYMSGQSKDHQSIAEQLGQMFDPKEAA